VTDVTPRWKPVASDGGMGKKKLKGRQKAGAKRWEEIRAAKLAPCRVCQPVGSTGSQLHHLVPRSQGGSDCESNIVPLCGPCHSLVTRGDREACARLRASLTDSEYAYAAEVLGEGRFERRYPVDYKQAGV
jgi:hypothetical protein